MVKNKVKTDLKRIGHYSFIVGLIIAVIVALIPQLRGTEAIVILVILGIIVGFLNITAKETTEFLIAALVLLMASSATALTLSVIHPTLAVMWGNILTFVAPAAIIVAVKTVIALAEER
jgi:hypothetical protein